MKTEEQRAINKFMVKTFYSVLAAEERDLEAITNEKLSLKEIHVIEAVFNAREEKGESSFSTVANILGVALGTLTKSYLKLEKKGYLTKIQDEKDKRMFHIVPTKLAEWVNNAHKDWHQKLIDGVVNTLKKEDLENFIAVLKDLSEFFHKGILKDKE